MAAFRDMNSTELVVCCLVGTIYVAFREIEVHLFVLLDSIKKCQSCPFVRFEQVLASHELCCSTYVDGVHAYLILFFFSETLNCGYVSWSTTKP